MAIKAVICPQCGARPNIDDTREFAFCSFCGTKIAITKDIINNITNNITNNNIHAQSVNIFNGDADFQIRAGELIKYNGSSTDVIIPETVQIIGKEAFKDCAALKSVKIPNTVTKICEKAFWGCSELANITIPKSVTTVKSWAFGCCFKLESKWKAEKLCLYCGGEYYGSLKKTCIRCGQAKKGVLSKLKDGWDNLGSR